MATQAKPCTMLLRTYYSFSFCFGLQPLVLQAPVLYLSLRCTLHFPYSQAWSHFALSFAPTMLSVPYLAIALKNASVYNVQQFSSKSLGSQSSDRMIR